jgi:hypothetical protein
VVNHISFRLFFLRHSLSPQGSGRFKSSIGPFRELFIDFYPKNVSRVKRLSRSQRTSTTTGGVKDKTTFVHKHPEEVAQDWFGFDRHMLRAVSRRSVSIANWSDNLAITS